MDLEPSRLVKLVALHDCIHVEQVNLAALNKCYATWDKVGPSLHLAEPTDQIMLPTDC